MTSRTPPAALRAALAQAGARSRTVDEHMFAVPRPGGQLATFRLQLYTGSGLRPVAVVTQNMREGASLGNAAEEYASAVWQRHLPAEQQPPLWIQRQLLTSGRFDGFTLVTFTPGEDYQLSSPRWCAISAAELTHLVGEPVDAERGAGYRPRPPEAVEQPRYAAAWVLALPAPEPFRDDGCLSGGLSPWRRIGAQLLSTRQGRDCCWYHHGDWHRVCSTALQLAGRAQRAGVPVDDIAEQVLARTEVAQMTGWEQEALESLLCIGTAIQLHGRLGRREYTNGQHRSQALMQNGVRRTLVVTCSWPSTTIG
ncbi:hypothetical protein [Streptosporangium lutulentum]|uniref:Uncharacterized protein n=1 Tax=Streptosporangium lutulentum TaxID=1461250 RepID=A0ABT9QUI7_9ACTN|nr:hypothetical protein [Streptosporangium lutulentum]MDP9850433.1 hypothetical protein [Streptosporangium lutulentum]